MNKKGKIIITILVIVILLLGGYIAYTTYTNNNETKELKTTKQELESLKKELNKIQTNTVNLTANNHYLSTQFGQSYEEVFHIYDMYGLEYTLVYAYQGEMYFGYAVKSGSMLTVAHMDENKSEWKKDKESGMMMYEEEHRDEDEMVETTRIYKLNVKENEIENAKIWHQSSAGDPQYNLYMIYKDGSVKSAHGGNRLESFQVVEELKGYHVIDLIQKQLSGDDRTTGTHGFAVKLKDGSTKEIPLKSN